jgi:hypothetical protein
MLALLTLGLIACQVSPDPPVREPVGFSWDDAMIGDQRVPNAVLVLEFGSFGCEYCREFQDSLLPTIEAHVANSGVPLQFGFVAMDTVPPYLQVAAMARCNLRDFGARQAIDRAFHLTTSWSSLPPQSLIDQMAVGDESCSAPMSTSIKRLARRASEWGITRTPTFLIGVHEGGGAVGWVVEGLRSELILATVDSVRQRLESRAR